MQLHTESTRKTNFDAIFVAFPDRGVTPIQIEVCRPSKERLVKIYIYFVAKVVKFGMHLSLSRIAMGKEYDQHTLRLQF